MSLFGSGGCTAHHWSDGKDTGEYKIDNTRVPIYYICTKKVQKCEHSGCNERREKWVKVDSTQSRNKAVRKLSQYLGVGLDA